MFVDQAGGPGRLEDRRPVRGVFQHGLIRNKQEMKSSSERLSYRTDNPPPAGGFQTPGGLHTGAQNLKIKLHEREVANRSSSQISAQALHGC